MEQLISISWEWIAIVILSLLFVIVLISLLKDLKRTKGIVKSKIIEEKCKNNLEKEYLSDINTHKMATNNKLKQNIDQISITKDRDKVIKALYKNYKNILLSDKEEHIFLSIATNKKIGETELFNLQKVLEELIDKSVISELVDTFSGYNIVGNREVIEDIFILLSKLQTKEHNLTKPSFSIILNENKSRLIIKIDRELELNQYINKVLSNNLTPIYLKKSNNNKKYYGVYLYLLKELANRVNALVKIDSNELNYTVEISIPIDIKEQNLVTNKPDMILKNSKNALIVTDNKNGFILTQYLKNLNINCEIESAKDLNKEIPNFMEFDIAFMDSKLFEPILTDYLETIKEYSNLKIIALVDRKNSLYPTKLVDEVVNIENISDSVYEKVLKIFKDDAIKSDNLTPLNNMEETSIIDKSLKKKRVLIADDDITNLHILTYLLKQYNLDVVAKQNGEEVLNTIDREKFDLIILDSIMPKLDGYKTIHKIRDDDRFNAIPVIIHSSFSMEDNRVEKIFELGFDSYLTKPFNIEDLESLLERYLAVDCSICKKNRKKDKKVNKQDLKEFIAIYGDSDKMIEKYLKENREEQVFLLLKDLKIIADKIDANKFLNSIETIENRLKQDKEIDNSLIYSLSNNLKELKSDIIKKLSA